MPVHISLIYFSAILADCLLLFFKPQAILWNLAPLGSGQGRSFRINIGHYSGFELDARWGIILFVLAFTKKGVMAALAVTRDIADMIDM